MSFDQHANLAYSTVASAPSPAASGTSLDVGAGEGARFPDPANGEYNCTVWPDGAIPTPDNSEIVRVTAKSGDTLTITRTQEGTSARSIIVGDQIALTVTAKLLTDIEDRAGGAEKAHTTDTNKWNNQAGQQRQVQLWDEAAGKVVWGYLSAIDVGEPPQIVAFSDGLGITEIASSGTLTPNFSASYEGTPSAADVDIQAFSSEDPEVNPGDYPKSMDSPAYTAMTGEPAINKETVNVGATVTWRLTATVDGQVKTKDHTLTYLNRKYFGPSTEATTLTSAQVLGLDATADGGSSLDADYRGTWVVDAAAGEYIWFAFRDQLQTDDGPPTFKVGGFEGGFSDKGTVSHTNDSGFTETYRLWRSDETGLGETTVEVT